MPQGSPINEILQMRQQGLSNNQIIQNLQREGYSNTQIFDSMNQADTKMAVEGMQPVPQDQATPGKDVSQDVFTTAPVGGQPAVEQPQMEQQVVSNQVSFNQSSGDQSSFSQPEPSMKMPQSSFQNEQVKVEELVEAIVEEKWDELLKDVNKVVQWKNKVEARVSEIEIKLDHLKESYSELQKAVMGKVNEYDKHIMEVGSDIKAMEKVFQKVLPTLTENVNELSKLKEDLKK